MAKRPVQPARRKPARKAPPPTADQGPKPSEKPARTTSAPVIANLPAGYDQLLKDLKARIAAAQVKAALSVNRELIELYWHIGGAIVHRQQSEGWGKSVVERLCGDIQNAFPGVSGFSSQNVWKMRAFYLAWTQEVLNLSHAVRELDGANLPQAVREIPWGHNTELFFKLKDPIQRLWYARQTIAHGWSRAVLVHQIESDFFARSGKAVTNFTQTLPPPQSDLAIQLLKDPYNFDFLTLAGDAQERDLERGLIEHLKKFLLELGAGFAFVGQQYHLPVGGQDFHLDLLFYHLHLRCFVVIDLKVEEFKPEFAGKMSFYVSVVDDLLRHAQDAPTIGLILCKNRNNVIVEYTLRGVQKPLGVAKYTITRILPEDLRASLPSPEQLARELQNAEDDAV